MNEEYRKRVGWEECWDEMMQVPMGMGLETLPAGKRMGHTLPMEVWKEDQREQYRSIISEWEHKAERLHLHILALEKEKKTCTAHVNIFKKKYERLQS